jgi:phosphoenolpyruvate carboxykinase (GTP)
MTDAPPAKLTDWQGQEWTSGCGRTAAHPNARFTAPASQCPSIDSQWENPTGVPVSAFVFGGRRADTIPLVFEPKSWLEGVYFAATIGSETTAAAVGAVGQVRRDPMAMLPFCGYNMGQYFQHWLKLGQQMQNQKAKIPKIFIVNWFRKDENGKFIWPGFGENARVLKWMFERVNGQGRGYQTFLGDVPRYQDLDWSGSSFSQDAFLAATRISSEAWVKEAQSHKAFFSKFEGSLPSEFMGLQEKLESNARQFQPLSLA